MAIFHCYVSSPEGNGMFHSWVDHTLLFGPRSNVLWCTKLERAVILRHHLSVRPSALRNTSGASREGAGAMVAMVDRHVHAELFSNNPHLLERLKDQPQKSMVYPCRPPFGTGKDASTAIFARPHLDGSGLRYIPLTFCWRAQKTAKKQVNSRCKQTEAPSGPRRWRRRESCSLMDLEPLKSFDHWQILGDLSVTAQKEVAVKRSIQFLGRVWWNFRCS